MKVLSVIFGSAALLASAIVLPASAVPITWTNWTAATPSSTAGTATGSIATLPNVGVSYSGEVQSLLVNYPSWTPVATFDAGGLNAPPQSGNAIQLVGGSNNINTITFSSAVVNPFIAIWSLGQGGNTAEFDFNATPTLLSGGPSAEYAGSSISVLGNTVFGTEGNGTVEFLGTFNSISWTNPVFENYYAFTVGIAQPARVGVPEPLTFSLFGAGLAGTALLRRRKKANKV